MSDNMFRWEKDGDNVVTLTMDDPGGSANTLNDTFIHDLEKTLHRLEQEKDDIAGVVGTKGYDVLSVVPVIKTAADIALEDGAVAVAIDLVNESNVVRGALEHERNVVIARLADGGFVCGG